jgi:hypothetical protein
MIVKLVYTNDLPIPVSVRSNLGSAQPLVAHQTLEMTFSLTPDEDGNAELVLICERPTGQAGGEE